MNEDSNKLIDQVNNYVDKCFQDAFVAENKECKKENYNFTFIIITDKKRNEKILYPLIFWCKYERVRRRVSYRLGKNIMKNFGLYYLRSDLTSVDIYEHTTRSEGNGIDPNHTIANIKVERSNKTKYFWLSAIGLHDEETDYNLPIPAKQLYKLILTYYNYTPEQLVRGMVEDSNDDPAKKYCLPDSIYYDWKAFKELYVKAFGYEIDDNYEFEFGLDVELLKE